MADNEDGGGQVLDDPDAMTAGAEGARSREGGQAGDAFLHTWKTKEDAEKGVKDLERIISQERSRADKALAEAEKIRSEVLVKLAEGAGAKPGAGRDEAAEAKQYRASLIDKYNKGELSGEEFIDLLESVGSQAEQRAFAKAEQRVKAAEERAAKIEARLADVDPEYVSRKQDVDNLMREFKEQHGVELTRQQAMAIAKKYAKPSQPARAAIPGGMAGSGGGGDEGELDSNSEAALNSLLALDGNKPLTQAERKALAKGRR